VYAAPLILLFYQQLPTTYRNPEASKELLNRSRDRFNSLTAERF
jgi:hypothetical protein